MSLSGDEAYVLAMDYVDETLEGDGALKGDDGKSAYQSWLDLGNTGTEEDFINSLKGEKGQVGEKGETGNNGKSSYEIWLDNGNVGTEQDFLDSLKGDGADGFSPLITENSNNTDEDYRLDIETKESKFTTPNLKADISKNIAEHNTSPDSHNDIRIFLNELNNRLNALANSDDETLDEMKEVVAYIKDNRSLIESITTTKVNVADIIDNLTTNVSNKPLSAAQGVVIKSLIDTLQTEVNSKISTTDLTNHTNNADIHVTADDKTNWNNATEEINNLEVGGTNLYTGTKDFTGNDWNSENFLLWTKDSETYKGFSIMKKNTPWGGLGQIINVKAGEVYTYSAYVKCDNEDILAFYDNPGSIIIEDASSVSPLKTNVSDYHNFASTEWMRVVITVKINKDGKIMPSIEKTDGSGYLYICGIKFERGNVATDWSPAPEDTVNIDDFKIVEDNNQYTQSGMNEGLGWYRFAKYSSDVNGKVGSLANSCEIIIKRVYATLTSEEHRILLKSRFFAQSFKSISSFSQYDSHIITKIRYVYDNAGCAYLDIYYWHNNGNVTSFILNNGKDFNCKWETVTPYLVAETTEGETVSAVFDIPENANPVTDLDLEEGLNTTQRLYTQIIDLRDTSIYDENTWYPCVGWALPHYQVSIGVNAYLGSSGKPSWATHEDGFSANLELLAKGSGWGATDGTSICLNHTCRYVDIENIPCSYNQILSSSQPVFWLRGGGKYYVHTQHTCTWNIVTTSYEHGGHSVAPATSVPELSFERSWMAANLSGTATHAMKADVASTLIDSMSLKTIDVPTNYIYDVIGDKEGNIQYSDSVGVVNLRIDFFTTYEIEASKILAIYVEADKKLKGFVWDPLIESQVISGNTLYSFEIKDINSNSGSVAVTSCKLLYMV